MKKKVSIINKPSIDTFCSNIIYECKNFNSTAKTLSPDHKKINTQFLANKFIKFFGLRYPLTLEQLVAIGEDSNLPVNSHPKIPKGRGFNCFEDGGGGYIYYKQDDAPTGQKHTTLHEIYEIIYKKLFPKLPILYDLETNLDPSANEFAANVHLPLEEAAKWIRAHSLDIKYMTRFFKCSYKTALIQTYKILNGNIARVYDIEIPMMVLLYELPYWEKREIFKYQQTDITFKKTENFGFSISQGKIPKLIIAQDEIPLIRPYSECLLNNLTNQMTDFLFLDINLIYKHTKLKVDMLVRSVRWSIFPYPVKTIFQIVPHNAKYLYKLTHNFPKPNSLYSFNNNCLENRNRYDKFFSGPAKIGAIMRGLDLKNGTMENYQ